MRGVDLLDLSYCLRTNKIDFDELFFHLPNTPEDVIRDVFVDHGRSSDFQRRFECFDFHNVSWFVCDKSCEFLCDNVTVDSFSLKWVENVKRRIDLFFKSSWNCIDNRQDVVEFWKINKTWMKPPVLINFDGQYLLVEGFTRFGTLCGLFEDDLLEADSLHKIFLGEVML